MQHIYRVGLTLAAAALLLLPVIANAQPKRLKGWPVELPTGTFGGYVLLPMNGAALADLDGDGKRDIIASAGDKVWALHADGKPLTGWPTTIKGSAQSPPAIGDIDGDGKLDVVQVGRGLRYSEPSTVNVFDATGKPLPGWPKTYANLIFHPPTLADLDGDGRSEIIVQIGHWPPKGTIEVLASDATLLLPMWSYDLDSYPLAATAVGDVDGDGKLDVAYLTKEKVSVRAADGTMLEGFPVDAAMKREYTGALVLADLDGDGKLDIIYCSTEAGDGGKGVKLHALTAKGKSLAGFPMTLTDLDVPSPAPPSIGDLDGDGKLEIVVPIRGIGVVVVAADGSLVGKPMGDKNQVDATVVLVDLDGDGKLELITDRNLVDGPAGDPTGTPQEGYVDAYHHDGTLVSDFPLRITANTMNNSIVVGDVDGDGALELVVVSSSAVNPPSSWVSLWSLPGSSTKPAPPWPMHGAGLRRANC
ncbi:MAG: VCBS repeat-containing protein, partial [Deltaproteobacteria bacterium]|nr:VCBS repeat-containing protein [Deltaproteobacteria bacterium]